MNVFNSLGSNYDLRFALRTLFASGDFAASETLKDYLQDRYDGRAELYYKGREALSEAVRLATDGQGSVLINGFTCYAVYEAVEATGAKTVYADIDPNNLHFDTGRLKKAHKNNPDMKAVVIQNTLGLAGEVKNISQYCKENDLILIEDLAHSFGTKYQDGTEAGRVGDFVMLSFGRDKVVDAVSGGALVIRNKKFKPLTPVKNPGLWSQIVDRLYPLHTWLVRMLFPIKVGVALQWIWSKLGLLPRSVDGDWVNPYRLPHWQANLVLYQLDRHERVKTHRDRIADIYLSILGREVDVPETARLTNQNSNLRFPAQVKNRQGLLDKLKKMGVRIADTWYDVPIAPPRFMSKTNYKSGECSTSEEHTKQIINLPTHINVSEKQAQGIAREVLAWQKST